MFQRSDLEIVLQQIVLAGGLDDSRAARVPAEVPSSSALDARASEPSAASAEEACVVEALRDAILATNDLDFINSWLAEDIDALPTDEAASAALAWDLERVIAAARKIATASTQETSAPELAPPQTLLNGSRTELAAETGDDALRAFASWAELRASLQQTDRLIELIARYGTHEALIAAATLAERQTIATLLVLGSKDTNGNGELDESEIAPADRLDFLYARGAYAGGSLGGLNNVELKLAGIAAATAAIGPDFVFESELDALQATATVQRAPETGDTSQVAAVSNGSSVILTGEDRGNASVEDDDAGPGGPAVDARQQFVRVGLDGRSVDDGNVSLRSGADGAQDLVIVGTAESDELAGSAGNDIISGESGNDTLSGGSGNDKISGGEGNDVVSGGSGNDDLQGGGGDDIIVTGEGSDTADGGSGDDFILSDSEDAAVAGGSGDDWLEGGGAAISGDASEADVTGNDVVVLAGGSASGGGGTDIFVGSGGNGRIDGGTGFDWVVHHLGDRATEITDSGVEGERSNVEGLSGSGGDDHIRGDDRSSDQIAADGNALTDITLVNGLQAYLDESLGTSGASVFDGGNIILGGGGSDIIRGGGGDDIIDGDLTLEVSILVDANGNGAADEGEQRVATLAELEPGILDGSIDAGTLEIIREITDASGGGDVDTAVFSGRLAEYEIAVQGQVTTVAHRLLDDSGAIVAGSTGSDGVDRLTRIERMQFSDQLLVLRSNGDTYVWQVPAALAIAIAEAIEDNASNSGSGSCRDDDRDDDRSGSRGGDDGSLLDQLAAAAADQDLGWLFDDSHGDEFDFSSLTAGDLGTATDTAILAGSSGSGTLDLSGIDWLLGSDGDMFAFDSSGDTDVAIIDLADLPVVDDAAAISLGSIDESYIGYQVEIVGVHDIMAADYAV